ncbi:unnamed protein product [Brassica napus]|uniref:(rape) hypothetical protein n=1 Tax=Brassica napus TaxID=3708 RepID=A0A816I928_BRANA|nr:unnamed protein product [Brassica napus]
MFSAITKESEEESSWEQRTTISSSLSEETKTEVVSGQSSSMMDEINREIEAHLGGKQPRADHVTRIGVSMDAIENDSERRKQLEEIEQQIKGAESETYQTKYGRMDEKEYCAWRCVNHDRNGVNEEEDASIIIPKYDIEAIIKEESISQGSESKTSSLLISLNKIIEMHKTKTLSRGVIKEPSSKEKTEIVKKLKVKLKSYRNIKIHELVTRTDFEKILTMAARYEELSSTSESYISRLSMYRSIIKEGIKASQRVQLAQQRARLLKDMAEEKQKKVEAEFALVKSLAQRGDALYVKIFAIKKLVLKLEAEKEEVDMNFQKIVGNLSRVIEEASQSYEEYLVVLRKWKEEKAAEEFSRETIESAEVVWVQFLSSL